MNAIRPIAPLRAKAGQQRVALLKTIMRPLQGLANPQLLLRKCDSLEAVVARHRLAFGMVLNVGSKDVRLPGRCTNLDIAAGPSVDVVADAHDLSRHFTPATFDTVVLSAVLQYCRHPRRVIEQSAIVMKPGGTLIVDAPFLQPYCADGKDLWRFTDDGLRELCDAHFDVLEVSVVIGAGSALAFAAQAAVRSGSAVRSNLSAIAAASILWPLRFALKSPRQSAGAFLLVARKRH